MPQRNAPGRELRKLLFVLVGAALLLGAMKFGAVDMLGDKIAHEVVHSAPERADQTQDERVARSTFVPLVRQKFPALARGVSDDSLVALAVNICSVLRIDEGVGRVELRRDVVAVLPAASTRAAQHVLDEAISTTCPWQGEAWPQQ